MNGRLLGVLAWLLVFPSPAPAGQCFRGPLVGEVTYVRDGDTIELGSMAIRFEGIAAPEWGEQGGDEARAGPGLSVWSKPFLKQPGLTSITPDVIAT